jgi:hypothetical protein
MASNFLFIVLLGGCSSDYLATAAFVEDGDNSLSMVEHLLNQARHCVAH